MPQQPLCKTTLEISNDGSVRVKTNGSVLVFGRGLLVWVKPFQPKPRSYFWWWLAVRGVAYVVATLAINLLITTAAF